MYYENYDTEEHESPPRIYASIYQESEDVNFRENQDVEVEELSRLEIVQRNVVEVEGIPPEFCKEKLLCTYSYFGQYGKVPKIEIIAPSKRQKGKNKRGQ